MAQFVDPERLWPLLAYFTAAVALVVFVEVFGGASEWSREAHLLLVAGWMVLLPLGALIVWKRTDPRPK